MGNSYKVAKEMDTTSPLYPPVKTEGYLQETPMELITNGHNGTSRLFVLRPPVKTEGYLQGTPMELIRNGHNGTSRLFVLYPPVKTEGYLQETPMELIRKVQTSIKMNIFI